MRNTFPRIRTLAAALGVAAALVVASCGDDKPSQITCSVEAPCPAGDTCWFDRGFCVPKDDGAGNCESGFVYRACETTTCPSCTECVPACFPVANAP